jgi:hypothetical protein
MRRGWSGIRVKACSPGLTGPDRDILTSAERDRADRHVSALVRPSA